MQEEIQQQVTEIINKAHQGYDQALTNIYTKYIIN